MSKRNKSNRTQLMKKALASTKSRPIARPVRIKDGVLSLVSSINNNRNALNTNAVFSPRLDYPEMRELYKTGIGNKIISIKADYALRDALQFENQVDEAFYKLNLAKQVKEAFKFALGFGRGIIVIVEIGVDLYQPLSPGFTRDSKFKLNVFSGDLVTAYGVSFDLMDYNFYKPEYYTVRGYQFHRSRVIEFNYIEPPQFDLPTYQYGGMSEFQLIRTAMITDGIVQRAGASILEKNSSLFYKITGFKDLLNSGEEADIINFFNILENNRSIYGAGMIDMEDDVTSVTQSLTDIDKVDQMSLRRLAMVTNIPLPMLVGENVQGLNSSGTTELQVFNWMLQNLRDSYAIDPISRLATLMGLGLVSFKKTNEMTPEQLAAYESTIIDNAAKLSGMGEDGQSYLVEKGVIEKPDVSTLFPEDSEAEEETEEIEPENSESEPDNPEAV